MSLSGRRAGTLITISVEDSLRLDGRTVDQEAWSKAMAPNCWAPPSAKRN